MKVWSKGRILNFGTWVYMELAQTMFIYYSSVCCFLLLLFAAVFWFPKLAVWK